MTVSWTCPQLTYGLSDGTTATGPGEVVQDETGRVEVRILVAPHLQLSNFLDAQDISGVTTGGDHVHAVECWPVTYRNGSGANQGTVAFSPAEVLVSDPQHQGPWSDHRAYVKGTAYLVRARFADGANVVEVCQLPSDPTDHRPGLISATVNVKLATPLFDTAETLLSDHIELLALAQRCPIVVARYEFRDGTRVVRTVLRPNVAAYKATNPLIPWTPPEFKSFFEQALPNVRQHRAAYDLTRLIAYYTRSFVEETLEIKFLMAGVFMEAFKFHWACNVGNLPRSTKANGLIKGFVKTAQSGKTSMYSFDDLLQLAAAHLGYQTTFTFIDDRNAMFHTGALSSRQMGHASAWPMLKPELIKLYRQMDDIILRILGYTGPIHPWERPDDRESFPSRAPIH